MIKNNVDFLLLRRPGALLICLAVLIQPSAAFAAGGDNLGAQLPLWSVVPFVGILLSIAICPLLNSHWWERNMAVLLPRQAG